jgi:hypothetical protein|tara:strand:- start:100 stop:489 length:390 start_codon:yes stop_codon:yes gene_type:complete
MEKIDNSNFILFAAHYYDNPQCMDEAEFFDDLKRFKYLKRLFNKYQETGEIKERLVLNHLMILYNLFGSVGTTKMVFFKLREYLGILKPFLVLLSELPDQVPGIGIRGEIIHTSDIAEDQHIVDVLRSI